MSPRGRREGGARSEDDRQRARLEREQRRAQREGRPVPHSLDDLPAAGPSGDATGLDRPTAPDGAGAAADRGTPVPAGSDDPRTRRERLARLRAGTAAAPEPRQDPAPQRGGETHGGPSEADRGRSAAPASGNRLWSDDTAPSPRTPEDPRPSARPESGQPWWATAGGDDAPPPPAAAPRSRSSAPADAATGRPPADAAPGRPPATRDAPSARRPATPTPDGGASRDPAPIRAPGLLGPTPGAAPRGRAAGGDARPASRETEDWFGEDGADDPEGRPDVTVDEPALVPLRQARPVRPSGTVAATVHTRTAPARRGVSRIAALLVLVPFVLAIAAAVFLFQPFTGDGDGEVRVRIPPGSSVDDIGALLKDRGVVSNSLAFSIRARLSGDGANLKAGTLRLKRGMSYGAALTALQQDPLPPSVIRVAIPEGLSRRETASSIEEAGVTGSYLSASARASGFDPTEFGQPRSRSGLEGFLFPATYELPRGGATAKNLVEEQLKSFRTNFEKVSMRRARRVKRSPYDVLIIASMIEREVRVPSERRLVSAVIWNRLEQDIALGIDATTRYAVRNWTRPLKQSEIDRDTPYDTRRKKGLPPTPIGSPGLSAIRAAANPADVDFIYYVVRPCGDGEHSFASSDAEFQKDVAAYNAAQRRAGGDPSPSDAKGC